MKTKSLFLAVLLGSVSAQATDWTQLINFAPSAKTERVQLDELGNVTATVVKLPSGKVRFVDFNNFQVSSRPVIQIDAKASDLGELCQFGVILDKPFKAKLTMQVNAAANLAAGVFGTGSKLDDFDNPVKVGKPVISLAKKLGKWGVYDKEVMKKSNGAIAEYYLSLLNEELLKFDGDTITMDLTKHNAMACDMLSENVVFEVNQGVEVEKGMPSRTMWLARDQFAAIYRKFWSNQPLVTSTAQTVVQNQVAEGIALGLSIGLTLRDDREIQSVSRVQKLLASVKSNIPNLDSRQKVNASSDEVHDAWTSTVEYTIPENSNSRYTRKVLSEPAVAKFAR